MDWAYSIAVYHEDWAPVGRVHVDPDWEPAIEWLRLVALNEGRELAPGGHDVQPLRSRRASQVVTGFRVTGPAAGGGLVAFGLPAQYLRKKAREVAELLVQAGRLASGDGYRYLVVAEEGGPVAVGEPAPAFTVRDVTPPPAPPRESMRSLVERAIVIGDAAPCEAPAFIAPGVLDEIVRLTREAAPNETGGALIGHVRRDPAARQVFTRVEAQVPARHTQASSSHLEFTTETWGELRRGTEDRGRGEVMVGWWHSHPVREWCRSHECDAGGADCSLARDVFSDRDEAVQRTVFSSAHSVALVANDIASDAVRFSAYGWSLGMVRPRSVFVLEAGGR
jgi:proteasome lid subunit RPN8/RPN11